MSQNEPSSRPEQAARAPRHRALIIGTVAGVMVLAVAGGGWAVADHRATEAAQAAFDQAVADCEALSAAGSAAFDAARETALADLSDAATVAQASLADSEDKVADNEVRVMMQDYLDQAQGYLDGEPTYITGECVAVPSDIIADSYEKQSWEIVKGISPMNAEIQTLTSHLTEQVTVIDESMAVKAKSDLDKQVSEAEATLNGSEGMVEDNAVREELKNQIDSAREVLESEDATVDDYTASSDSLSGSKTKVEEAQKSYEEKKASEEAAANASGSSGSSSSSSSSGNYSSGSSSSSSSSGNYSSGSSSSSSSGSSTATSGGSSGSSSGSSGSSGSSSGGSSSGGATTQPSKPSVTVAEVAAQLPAPTGSTCSPYRAVSGDSVEGLVSFAWNFRATAPWSRFEASGTDGWVTVTAYTCLKN